MLVHAVNSYLRVLYIVSPKTLTLPIGQKHNYPNHFLIHTLCWIQYDKHKCGKDSIPINSTSRTMLPEQQQYHFMTVNHKENVYKV